jgi:hypothetical protein
MAVLQDSNGTKLYTGNNLAGTVNCEGGVKNRLGQWWGGDYSHCPSSNGLGQSELFRDGGSGLFGLEFRRLSTDVAIVAV